MKQLQKAIYFDDYKSASGKQKSFSIAFGIEEGELYNKVARLSSCEIKSSIGINSYHILKTRAQKEGRTINQYIKRLIEQIPDGEHILQTKDVTFCNSKNLPFQRWYPYIEGYSPNFVTSLIEQYCPNASVIYEPFAGTGTTIFAADQKGKNTYYSEVNPLLQYLIDGKIKVLNLSKRERKRLSSLLFDLSDTIILDANECAESEELFNSFISVFGNKDYFPREQFSLILRLKTYIKNIEINEPFAGKLLTIAVFSCLIPVSYLKKQGDLRFKTEDELQREIQTLDDILPNKIREIAEDVANLELSLSCKHRFVIGNAKKIANVRGNNRIQAVITSPPYLNGTNYFRNTKLELWFLDQLNSEDDLRKFRDQALTSGINDVVLGNSKHHTIPSRLLQTTLDELYTNNYDRRIPVMAKCYFEEMYDIFDGLRHLLTDHAKIMIDLGDSMFSGIHIQTDNILAEVLSLLGYHLENRTILRQRRSRGGALLSQVLLVFDYTRE